MKGPVAGLDLQTSVQLPVWERPTRPQLVEDVVVSLGLSYSFELPGTSSEGDTPWRTLSTDSYWSSNAFAAAKTVARTMSEAKPVSRRSTLSGPALQW